MVQFVRIAVSVLFQSVFSKYGTHAQFKNTKMATGLDPDLLVKAGALTNSNFRDVYPAIDRTRPFVNSCIQASTYESLLFS
jgi:hypothetical protein